MARVHLRCSKNACRARHTLPKHPDDYKRKWKCHCGCEKFVIIRDPIKHSGHVDCTCMGYNWGGTPHRRGSRYCWFRRNGEQRMPGDEDFNDPNYEETATDGFPF